MTVPLVGFLTLMNSQFTRGEIISVTSVQWDLNLAYRARYIDLIKK